MEYVHRPYQRLPPILNQVGGFAINRVFAHPLRCRYEFLHRGRSTAAFLSPALLDLRALREVRGLGLWPRCPGGASSIPESTHSLCYAFPTGRTRGRISGCAAHSSRLMKRVNVSGCLGYASERSNPDIIPALTFLTFSPTSLST